MANGKIVVAQAEADIGTVAYRVSLKAGHHTLIADEHLGLGGRDAGPAPFELILSGLGACTAVTLKMYAERKQWPLTAVHVALRYTKEGDADQIDRTIAVGGALNDEQRARLAEIAERTPVTLALKRGLPISTTLR